MKLRNSNQHRLANEADNVKYNILQQSRVFHFGTFASTQNTSGYRSWHERKKTKKLKNKILLNNTNKKRKTVCMICTELQDGNVTLKCGHEMCPTCFARHSRVNNTCPYCRDEFAEKVKQPEKMPVQVAESIMCQTVQEYYYNEVHDEIKNIFKDSTDLVEDLRSCVYGHMCQSSMNMFFEIENWLETTEEEVTSSTEEINLAGSDTDTDNDSDIQLN